MKRAFVASVLLLVALLISGCATNNGVRRMIGENNAIYSQQIDQLEVRINDLSGDQEVHKENLLNYLKKQNQLLIEFIDQLEETATETVNEEVTPVNAY